MKKLAFDFTPRDKQIMLGLLLGGSALGGSAAVATSLMNYLNSIKQEKELKKDTSADDDTLYLNLPTKAASISGGLGLAAGTVGALATYAVIHDAYQKWKKKQLQQQLDAMQQMYVDTLNEESEQNKQAAIKEAKGIGLLDTLTSLPVAASVLLALTGGVVANNALKKSFPTPTGKRRSTDPTPRRVVIRSAPGKESKDEDKDGQPDQDEVPPKTDEEFEPFYGDISQAQKVAYASSADGMELVLRTVLGSKEHGERSGLRDLVKAAACGRIAEIKHAMSQHGYDAMLGMVKGASHEATAPGAMDLAVSWLVRDPLVGPSVKLAAAAEYADMAPTFFKLATLIDGTDRDDMTVIGCMTGKLMRVRAAESFMPKDLVKAASELPEGLPEGMVEGEAPTMDEVIGQILSTQGEDSNGEKSVTETMQGVESLDSDEEDTKKKKKTEVQSQGADAEDFVNKHKDDIDAVLNQ